MAFHWLWTVLGQFYAALPLRLWGGFIAAGLIAEMVFAAERGQPLHNKLLNLRCSVIYAVGIFVLSPAIGTLSVAIVRALGGGGVVKLNWFSGAGIAVQLAAYLLIAFIRDFFFYWWHRAQHEISWLWDEHALHHSDVSVNVSTSLRQHWLESVGLMLCVLLPFSLLFDIPLRTVGIIPVIFPAWGFFIHCNLRLELGPLTPIFAGPQFHRLHHSRLPGHLDRNYAANFPFWDIIFGTYLRPGRGEWPPTGLVDGTRIDSAWLIVAYPFVQWCRKLRAWRLRRGSNHSAAISGLPTPYKIRS